MRVIYFLFLLLGFWGSGLATGAWEFSANSLQHEKALDTTIATGDVVLERAVEGGRQKLQADKVTYNGKENIVTAIGNVEMWDEAGNYYQSDYLEIMGDFKHAIIENMLVQLKDYGTLKADSARRQGEIAEFQKASYSACKFCKDKPQSSLLWELQANKVIHDEDDKVLKYYGTKLLVKGVPVFYMPYFYYPDPTVKRKQGFLLPDFGSDRNVGSYLSQPYFIPIGEHADVTINPILTSKGGQLLSGNFRLRKEKARLDGELSFTEAPEVQGATIANSRIEKNSDRWHLDIEGSMHHDENWRSGFALQRASDKNYFRRYPFWGNSGNFLQSRIFAEHFSGRDYAQIAAHHFQDLRLDSEAAPRIYPNLDAYFSGERDSLGGLWDIYGNIRLQDRSGVIEDRRLYGKATYQLPYYSDSGYIATGYFNLYSKVQSSDFDTPTNSFGQQVSDEDSADALAQAGFKWRMPFARNRNGARQIIEPMVAIYVAENADNDRNLNNNDAKIFALDSHNIMQAHRFNGYDRFDGGQRIAFGIRGLHQARDYNLSGFLGQLYEFSEDEVLKEELGIEEGASDFIASIQGDTYINQLGHVYWDNQISLDSENGNLNRYFMQAALIHDDWSFHNNYLYTRENPFLSEQNQISWTADKKLSKYWRGGIFATIDWSERTATNVSRSRAYGTDFTYDDECFNFKISAYRDFTNSPDVEDGYSFIVSFDLKTLGGTGGISHSNIRKLSGF